MSTVTALYAGSLHTLQPEGQRTGIYKQQINTAIITNEGIVGDHQADRRFHGGPEKALHQFALQSYDVIIAEFPELCGFAVPGSMGENISSSDLTDSTVCIGDIYRVGGVIAQVSQPRSPCWKINHKFCIQNLSRFVEQQHITGWYYRVLEKGKICIGDEIELIERLNEGISVERFIGITKQHRPDTGEFETAIMSRGLSSGLQARLKARLQYLRRQFHPRVKSDA